MGTFKKYIKRLAIGLLVLILLISALYLSVYIPFVQKKIVSFIEQKASEALDAEVTVGYFKLGFFADMELERVQVINAGDTLLQLQQLQAALEFRPLFDHKAVLSRVELSNLNADIYRLIPDDDSAQDAEPEQPADTSAAWEVEVREMLVSDSYLLLYDSTDMMDLRIDIGALRVEDLRIDSFVYTAQYVSIHNTKVSYVSPYIPDLEIDTTPIFFVFKAAGADLYNSEFYYNDSLMTFRTGGRHLSTSGFALDVADETVDFTEITLNESYYRMIFINDTLDTADGGYDWKVSSERVRMQQSEFMYDIQYKPEHQDEFDYNHIHLYNIDGNGSNLFWSFNKLYIRLNEMAFNENKRVDVLSASGDLYMDDDIARFTDFKVKTSRSNIKLNLLAGYDLYNFEFREDRPLNMQLKMEMQDWGDLDYFAGTALTETEDYRRIKDRDCRLDVALQGTMDSLNTRIDAEYNRGAKLSARTKFSGLSSGQISYDAQVDEMQLRKRDIALFVNDSATLANLPRQMHYSGTVAGTDKSIHLIGLLNSDYGKQQLDIAATFGDSIMELLASVDGTLNAEAGVEHFALTASAKGSSLNDLNAEAGLDVIGLRYKDALYDSLNITFTLSDGQYNFDLRSRDHKAMFDLKAEGELTDSSLSMVSNLELDSFAMKKSGLFESPEVLKLDAIMGLNLNFNTLDAKFGAAFTDIYLIDTLGGNYVERINIAAEHSSTETHFDIVSDHNTFKLDIYGNLDSLQYNFEKYVAILMLKEPRSARDSLHFPRIELLVDIQKPYELLGNKMSDELPHFTRFYMQGLFDNTDNSIDLTMYLPLLIADGNSFDSTVVEIKGNRNKMNYNLHSNVMLDSALQANISIDGLFEKRALTTHLELSDRDNMDFIDFTLKSKATDTGYLLHILGDSLTILANRWSIHEDNVFEIGKETYSARNIELHRADKGIYISSEDAQKELSLQLENIDLSVFNRVLKNDSLLAGNMNSKLQFWYGDRPEWLMFRATIDSMKMLNYYIGEFDIRKVALNDRFLDLDARMSNSNGKSFVHGKLGLGDENSINIDLQLGRLNIAYLNDVLRDYVYDLRGRLSTRLAITGTYDEPVLNGSLRFHDFLLGSKDLREVFTFNDAPITIRNNVIDAGRFRMYDRNKQPAYFTGNMHLEKNQVAFSDFHLKADGFEIMHSTMDDNEMVYGDLVVNLDVKLDGTMDDLRASSKLVLDYPTNINYVFPEDLSVDNNEGIVIFSPLDTASLESAELDSIIIRDDGLLSLFKFLDAELEVTNGCKFNLYFDKSMKDYLSITGSGNFSYIVDEEGPKVSGLLNIDKGKLNYSLPMVSMEELNIGEGSFIQLTNDLNNPIININASSKIWAQTGDLIEDYNKNLEVTVFVYMRGTLDNLIVQFDVSPETNDALISSRIAQMTEKERTMNAVNLLVRGQFASKQSNMTIDMSAYVGGLIAKSLNKLISERIKFVDMSFDIKSFNHINSSGAVEAQSNMFFNVEKSFYHNRLRVSYQGNLTARDEDISNPYSNTESYAQSNFQVEYDINKRGNFQAVFFVKDTYEDIMEGDVSSTGGGLKMRKTYATFGDIFRRSTYKKDKKQQKKEERQGRKAGKAKETKEQTE